MDMKTFDAEVVNGHLRFDEPLNEIEGQRVRVTLTIIPTGGQLLQDLPPTDVEPPEWLDVEKDVYVKMPFRGEILKDVVIVERGPGKPCTILPEPLPDD